MTLIPIYSEPAFAHTPSWRGSCSATGRSSPRSNRAELQNNKEHSEAKNLFFSRESAPGDAHEPGCSRGNQRRETPTNRGVPGHQKSLGTLRRPLAHRTQHLRPRAWAQSGQNCPKNPMVPCSHSQVACINLWEGACQVIQVIQGNLGIGGKPKSGRRRWPNALDHLDHLDRPPLPAFLALSPALDCGKVRHSRRALESEGPQPARRPVPRRSRAHRSSWHTSPHASSAPTALETTKLGAIDSELPNEANGTGFRHRGASINLWEGACQVIQVIQGNLGIGGKPKSGRRRWPNALDHLDHLDRPHFSAL